MPNSVSFPGLADLPMRRPVLVQGSIVENIKAHRISREQIMSSLLEWLFVQKSVPVIFVPAFTFSVFQSGIFNPLMRAEIGYISTYVEDYCTILRTSHPMYSFYCITNPTGPQHSIPLDSDYKFAFGVGSFYSYLSEIDACQVCLNLPDGRCMTFYHHAEKVNNATHRFEKEFEIKRKVGSELISTSCSVYVRCDGIVTDVSGMEKLMWRKGIWNGIPPTVGQPTERWTELNVCLEMFSDIGLSDYDGLLYKKIDM